MAGLGTGAPIVKVYHEKSMILPDVSRVLACLCEKKIEFETHTTSYKSLLRLQASTHAPVPFYDGPTFLEESREICRYIAETYEHHGYPFLLGKDALERASIEQWLHHEEHTFNPPSRALFCHLAFPPDEDDDIEMQKAKLEDVLEVYEQRLSDSEFLAGNKFTLADLVHMPNSHYIKASGKFVYLYDSRKNVQRWWNDIFTRDSWKQVLSYMTKVEQKQHELEELEKQKQQEWQKEHHTATGRRIRLDSRKHTSTKSQTILIPPPGTASESPMVPQAEQPSADYLSEKAPVSSSQRTTHKLLASPSKQTTFTTHQEIPPDSAQSTQRTSTSSSPSLGTFPTAADKPPRTHGDMSSIRNVSVPSDTTDTDLPSRPMLSSSKEVGAYIEPTPEKPPALLDNFSESDGTSNGASHSQTSTRADKEDSDRFNASDLYKSDRKSAGVYSAEKESISYTAHTSEATYGKSTTPGATDSSRNKIHSTEAHQMLQSKQWHAATAGLRNLQGDIHNSMPSQQVKPSKDVQQYPPQDSEQSSIHPVAQEAKSMKDQLVRGPETITQTPHTDQTRDVSSLHRQHAVDARRISEDEASSDRRRKDAHWPMHSTEEDAQAIPFQTAYDDSQDTTQRAREASSAPSRAMDQDVHDTSQGIRTYDSAPSRLQPMDASHDVPIPSKKATPKSPHTTTHIPTGYQGAQEFIQGRKRPKQRPYDAQGSTEEEKVAQSPPSKAQIFGSRGLHVSPPKELLNEDGYDVTGPSQTRYTDDQDDWMQARDSTSRKMNQDDIEETKMADSEPFKAQTLDSQQAIPQKHPPAEDPQFASSTFNRRYLDDQDSTKKSKHTASTPRRMEAPDSLEETKAGESALPREQPSNILQAATPPSRQGEAKDACSLIPPSQEGYAGSQAVSRQPGDPDSMSRRITAQDARVTFVESEAADSTSTREKPSDPWQAVDPLPGHKIYDAHSSTSPFQDQDTTVKSEDTTRQQMRGQGAKETKLSDSASPQVQPLDYERSDSHVQRQEEIKGPRGTISPHKKRYTDVEDITKHPGDKMLGEDAQDDTEETKALDSMIFKGRAQPQDTHQSAITQLKQAADKDALGVTPLSPTRYPTTEDSSRQPRTTASTPTEKAVQDGRDAFRKLKSVDFTSSRAQLSDVRHYDASFQKQEATDSRSTTVPFQRRYTDVEGTTKEPRIKPKETGGEIAQDGFEETKALDSAIFRGRAQPQDTQQAAITPPKQAAAKDALGVTPLSPTRYPAAEDTSRQPRRTASTPTEKAVQDGRDAFRESMSVDSTSSREQPSDVQQAAASLQKQEATDSRSTTMPFQRRYRDIEDTTKAPRDKPKETVGEDAQDVSEETKALDSTIFLGTAQTQDTQQATITPSQQAAAKDALGATPLPPTRYPTVEDPSRQPRRAASTPTEKAIQDGRDALRESKSVDPTSFREQPSDVRRAATSFPRQEAADSRRTTMRFQRRYPDVEDTTKEPRDKPKELVGEDAQDVSEETKALESEIFRGRAQPQGTQRAAITPLKQAAAKDAVSATPFRPTRYPTAEDTSRQPRTVSTPTEKAVQDGKDAFREPKSVNSTSSREQPSDVRRDAASLPKQAADSRSTTMPLQRRYRDIEDTTKEPRDNPKEMVGEDGQDGFEETKALNSAIFRGRAQPQDAQRAAITPSELKAAKDALVTPLPPTRYPTEEDTSRQPRRTATTPTDKVVQDSRDAFREPKSVDSKSSREQPSDVPRAAALPKQEAADSRSTTMSFQRRYPDIEDTTKEQRVKPKETGGEIAPDGFEETKALDSAIFRGRAQPHDTQQAAITPSKLEAAKDAHSVTPLPPKRYPTAEDTSRQLRRTASTPTEKAVQDHRDAFRESKSVDSTSSREEPSDVPRDVASFPKQDAADFHGTTMFLQRRSRDIEDTTKEPRDKPKVTVGEDAQDGFEETKALDSAIFRGRAQPQDTQRGAITPSLSKLEAAKDALGAIPLPPTRYPTAEDTSRQSIRTALTPTEKAVQDGRDAFGEPKSVDSISSREQPSDVRQDAASLPKQEAADSPSTTMPFERRYPDIEDTTKEPGDKPKETVGQDVQDTSEETKTTDSVLFTIQPSDMPRAAITPSKKAAAEDAPSVSPPLPTRYPSAEYTNKQSIGTTSTPPREKYLGDYGTEYPMKKDIVNDQKEVPPLSSQPTSRVQHASETSQEAAPDEDVTTKSTIDQWWRASKPLQDGTPISGDDVTGLSTDDQMPTPMGQEAIPSAQVANEITKRSVEQRVEPQTFGDVQHALPSLPGAAAAERAGEHEQMQGPTMGSRATSTSTKRAIPDPRDTDDQEFVNRSDVQSSEASKSGPDSATIHEGIHDTSLSNYGATVDGKTATSLASEAQVSDSWSNTPPTPVNARSTKGDEPITRILQDQGAQPPPEYLPDSTSHRDVPTDLLDKTKMNKPTSTDQEGMTPTAGPGSTLESQLGSTLAAEVVHTEWKSTLSGQESARAMQSLSSVEPSKQDTNVSAADQPKAPQRIFRQQARPSAPITREVQTSDNQGAISKIQEVSPGSHPTDYSAILPVPTQEQVLHATQTSPGPEGTAPAQGEMGYPPSSEKQGSHVGPALEPHEGLPPDSYGAVVDKETIKSLSRQAQSLEASPDSTPTHGYFRPTSGDEHILLGQGARSSAIPEPVHPNALDSASTQDVPADSLVSPKKLRQHSTDQEDNLLEDQDSANFAKKSLSSEPKEEEGTVAATEQTKATQTTVGQQDISPVLNKEKHPSSDVQYDSVKAQEVAPKYQRVDGSIRSQEQVPNVGRTSEPHEGPLSDSCGATVEEPMAHITGPTSAPDTPHDQDSAQYPELPSSAKLRKQETDVAGADETKVKQMTKGQPASVPSEVSRDAQEVGKDTVHSHEQEKPLAAYQSSLPREKLLDYVPAQKSSTDAFGKVEPLKPDNEVVPAEHKITPSEPTSSVGSRKEGATVVEDEQVKLSQEITSHRDIQHVPGISGLTPDGSLSKESVSNHEQVYSTQYDSKPHSGSLPNVSSASVDENTTIPPSQAQRSERRYSTPTRLNVKAGSDDQSTTKFVTDQGEQQPQIPAKIESPQSFETLNYPNYTQNVSDETLDKNKSPKPPFVDQEVMSPKVPASVLDPQQVACDEQEIAMPDFTRSTQPPFSTEPTEEENVVDGSDQAKDSETTIDQEGREKGLEASVLTATHHDVNLPTVRNFADNGTQPPASTSNASVEASGKGKSADQEDMKPIAGLASALDTQRATSGDEPVTRSLHDLRAQSPELTQAQPTSESPLDPASQYDVPTDVLDKAKKTKLTSTDQEGMAPTSGPGSTLESHLSGTSPAEVVHAEQKSTLSDQESARARQPLSSAEPSKQDTNVSAADRPEVPQTVFHQQARTSAPITREVQTSDNLGAIRKIQEVSPDNQPTDYSAVSPVPTQEQVPHAPQTSPDQEAITPTRGEMDSLLSDAQLGPEKVWEPAPDDHHTHESTMPFVTHESVMDTQPDSSLSKVALAERKFGLSDQDPVHSAQESVPAATEQTKALPKPIVPLQQETPDKRKAPTSDTQYASQIIPSQEKVSPDVPSQDKVSQAEHAFESPEGSTPHTHGSVLDEQKTRPLASLTKSLDAVLDLTQSSGDVHPTSGSEPPRSVLPFQGTQTPSATQTPPPFMSHEYVPTEDRPADSSGEVQSMKPSASPDAPHATTPGEVALSEQKLTSADRDSSHSTQLPSSDEPMNEDMNDSDHSAQPFSSAAPDQAKDLRTTIGQPDISPAPGTSKSPSPDAYDAWRKVNPASQLVDKSISSQEQVSHPELASKRNEGPTDQDSANSSSEPKEEEGTVAAPEQTKATQTTVGQQDMSPVLSKEKRPPSDVQYDSVKVQEVAPKDQHVDGSIRSQEEVPNVGRTSEPHEEPLSDLHGAIVEESMAHITGPTSASDTPHDQDSAQYPELPSSTKKSRKEETDVDGADETKAKQMTFGQPALVPSEATRSVTDQGAQQPQLPADVESPSFETLNYSDYTRNASHETLDKNESPRPPSVDQEVMSPKVVPASALDPQRVPVPDEVTRDKQEIAMQDLTRSAQLPFSAAPTKEESVVEASGQDKSSETTIDQEVPGLEHRSFSEGSTTDSRGAITDEKLTTSTSGRKKGSDASVMTATHHDVHPPTVNNLPEHRTQPPASTEKASVEALGKVKSTGQEDMKLTASLASVLDTQRSTSGDKPVTRSLHVQRAPSPELTQAQPTPESPLDPASQYDVPTDVLDKAKKTKLTSTDQEGMAPTSGTGSTLESHLSGTSPAEVVHTEQKSTLSDQESARARQPLSSAEPSKQDTNVSAADRPEVPQTVFHQQARTSAPITREVQTSDNLGAIRKIQEVSPDNQPTDYSAVSPVPTQEQVPHAPQTSPDQEAITPTRGEMDSLLSDAQLGPEKVWEPAPDDHHTHESTMSFVSSEKQGSHVGPALEPHEGPPPDSYGTQPPASTQNASVEASGKAKSTDQGDIKPMAGLASSPVTQRGSTTDALASAEQKSTVSDQDSIRSLQKPSTVEPRDNDVSNSAADKLMVPQTKFGDQITPAPDVSLPLRKGQESSDADIHTSELENPPMVSQDRVSYDGGSSEQRNGQIADVHGATVDEKMELPSSKVQETGPDATQINSDVLPTGGYVPATSTPNNQEAQPLAGAKAPPMVDSSVSTFVQNGPANSLQDFDSPRSSSTDEAVKAPMVSPASGPDAPQDKDSTQSTQLSPSTESSQKVSKVSKDDQTIVSHSSTIQDTISSSAGSREPSSSDSTYPSVQNQEFAPSAVKPPLPSTDMDPVRPPREASLDFSSDEKPTVSQDSQVNNQPNVSTSVSASEVVGRSENGAGTGALSEEMVPSNSQENSKGTSTEEISKQQQQTDHSSTKSSKDDNKDANGVSSSILATLGDIQPSSPKENMEVTEQISKQQQQTDQSSTKSSKDDNSKANGVSAGISATPGDIQPSSPKGNMELIEEARTQQKGQGSKEQVKETEEQNTGIGKPYQANVQSSQDSKEQVVETEEQNTGTSEPEKTDLHKNMNQMINGISQEEALDQSGKQASGVQLLGSDVSKSTKDTSSGIQTYDKSENSLMTSEEYTWQLQAKGNTQGEEAETPALEAEQPKERDEAVKAPMVSPAPAPAAPQDKDSTQSTRLSPSTQSSQKVSKVVKDDKTIVSQSSTIQDTVSSSAGSGEPSSSYSTYPSVQNQEFAPNAVKPPLPTTDMDPVRSPREASPDFSSMEKTTVSQDGQTNNLPNLSDSTSQLVGQSENGSSTGALSAEMEPSNSQETFIGTSTKEISKQQQQTDQSSTKSSKDDNKEANGASSSISATPRDIQPSSPKDMEVTEEISKQQQQADQSSTKLSKDDNKETNGVGSSISATPGDIQPSSSKDMEVTEEISKQQQQQQTDQSNTKSSKDDKKKANGLSASISATPGGIQPSPSKESMEVTDEARNQQKAQGSKEQVEETEEQSTGIGEPYQADVQPPQDGKEKVKKTEKQNTGIGEPEKTDLHKNMNQMNNGISLEEALDQSGQQASGQLLGGNVSKSTKDTSSGIQTYNKSENSLMTSEEYTRDLQAKGNTQGGEIETPALETEQPKERDPQANSNGNISSQSQAQASDISEGQTSGTEDMNGNSRETDGSTSDTKPGDIEDNPSR